MKPFLAATSSMNRTWFWPMLPLESYDHSPLLSEAERAELEHICVGPRTAVRTHAKQTLHRLLQPISDVLEVLTQS
jgi:hypothetical protein